MIELLNNAARGWWNWMWPMFWQVSALIAILAVFDLFLRKRIWPQVRYALWLLVILKLILPPTFSLSTSITAPVRTQGVHMLEWLGAGRTPDDAPSVGPGTEMTMHPMDTDIESTSMMDDMTGSEVKSLQQAGSSELTGSGSSIKLYWKVYVMAIWLMGVITLALWATVRLPSLKRLHIDGAGASSSNLPQWLRLLMTKTAEKLHLRKLPKVVLSQYIASPGVFGTFRPVLVLPADTVHRLSHQRAEHILLHELAHIKRGDLMLNTFYTLLQIVYWFNPLLWPVRRKLQNMREVCCDATVAGILREKTMDYRETILETAKWLLAKPMRRSGIGLLGLVEDSHSLLVRLKWLDKNTWE